jgi:hypothetical protein
MKKALIALALILSPLAANAQQKTYTYTEMCWYLGQRNHPWIEKATCKITDIRNKQGFLDKRIIQAVVNKSGISYTVKSWFGSQGFMTWDSDRQAAYKNQYRVASPTAGVVKDAKLPSGYAITEVTKDLWVRQISWD